jgi:beta-lactamase class A
MAPNPTRSVKLASMLLAQPPPSPVVPSDRAVAVARAYARHRQGRVAFAVVDSHDRLRGLAASRRYRSASVIKAMLLVADLGLHRHAKLGRHEKRLLGPMIRRSSNEAAERVFGAVGKRRVLRLARRARMRRFSLPSLFEARITAADQARFFARLDHLLPARHRVYAFRLLAGIVPSQRWGIPLGVGPDWRVYFKGGWRHGLVHQVARLEREDESLALAILTDEDPSEDYGHQTLRGIAKRLLPD